MKTILKLLRQKGLNIISIKQCSSGSVYVRTSIGLVRISDHHPVKFNSRAARADFDLRVWMGEKRITEILNLGV